MNLTVRSENIVRPLVAILCFAVGLSFANAAELKEARVTQVVKDVKLLPEQAAPRPATVNDPVRDGTAVRTGVQSRSELTFTDETITRLGANTIFSFKEGTRVMDLGEGAILFQVPKGAGGATIRTAAVTAAITGTTGIGEFHHATANNPHPVIKWLCLEGTIHLYLTNGSKDSVVLHPGEMEVTDGTTLTTPVTFDIAQLAKTSLLIIGFDTPLPSLPLITIEIQRQLDSRLAGGLNENLLALNDIADQVDRGITAQNIVNSSPSPTETPTVTPTVSPTITPMPSGTPSKTGTPEVIVSSTPYAITASTTITTDPSITTNDHTDFGKIYRGQSIDGNLAPYLFGSETTFDSLLLDPDLEAPGGLAVFKFSALQLTGDPMISTVGGPQNLVLVGVDGITSGGPGGVLHFAGLDGLLLATQDGSINLGPEISFDGLQTIHFYARGTNSILNLGSDVTTTAAINLWGQGGVNLSGNLTTNEFRASTDRDFNFNDGSINASRSIYLVAGRDINFNLDNSLSFEMETFGLDAGRNLQIADTLEVFASTNLIAGAISVNGDLNLTFRPNNDNPGEVSVRSITGDTTVHGAIRLVVDTSKGGHIDDAGEITLAVGHDLTADSLFALIDNEANGTNLSPMLSVNVTGDLTTNSFVDLEIANTGFSDSGFVAGGNITSNAVIGLHAGNLNSGDYMQAFIFNDGDGHIGGNALINGAITNDLMAKSDVFFDIQNSADTDGESLVPGGMIGGNATVNLSVGGDVNAGGVLEIAVLNNDHRFLPAGGTISGDATVNVTAGSIFAGDFFQPLINNTNGSIGGDATVSVHVTGGTNVGTEGFFRMTNDAGTIGGDALFSFIGGNVSIGDTLFAEIQNREEGEIEGDATLGFHANDLTVTDTANFQILNGLSDSNGSGAGGSIGGNAFMFVALGSLNAPILVADIDNTGGGSVGGDATVFFSIDGDVNTTVATFAILNNANDVKALPGSIGGQASISVNSGGNFAANTLAALVDNRNGGSIGTAAAIQFNIGGTLTTTGDAFFQILGGFEGVLPSLPAGEPPLPPSNSIKVDADALAVGGNLDASIDGGGGTISGSATIDMNVAGSATISSDATFEIFEGSNTTPAAINFNGGSYDVGGTFLASIDGNGAITFNNASAHADVLKAGVFGANGVLNIGGGTLSANTTLKLYAPGSNGQLNFISNVTLGGNSAKILAANSITIFNGVVVTVGNISDENPASVYTNHANYTGFGGNGSTTGTFAGSGANDPQPLSQAPPFGTSASAPSVASHPPAAAHPPRRIAHSPNSSVVHGRPPRTVAVPQPGGNNNRPPRIVTVRDSDELISLIQRETQPENGHGGHRDVARTTDGRDPGGTKVARTTGAGNDRTNIRNGFSPSTNRLP